MRNRTVCPAADDACPLCSYWRCRCRELFGLALRLVLGGGR